MTDSHATDRAMPQGADGAAASGPPSPSDWRAPLTGELRRAAEKFASPADVVKSYAALERRLGRSVTVPGDDAPPEEIEAFHARLGRPPTPADYRIALPDDLPAHLGPGPADEARLAGFLAAVHAAGAPRASVQAAVDWYWRARAEAAADTERQAAARNSEADEALRREWGAAYDRRLALAQRAVRHFGGDDLAGTLDRSGLGNHPAWVRAFARIGEALAEDTLVSGDPAGGELDARTRIDAIMTDHFGRPSYATPAVQAELRRHYETLYGTGAPRDGTG